MQPHKPFKTNQLTMREAIRNWGFKLKLQATFLYSIYHQQAGKTNLFYMRGVDFRLGIRYVPCVWSLDADQWQDRHSFWGRSLSGTQSLLVLPYLRLADTEFEALATRHQQSSNRTEQDIVDVLAPKSESRYIGPIDCDSDRNRYFHS